MNIGSWMIWGFAATVVMTTILVAAQYLRLTRMSLPYLLGMLVTGDRDKAKVMGVFFHLLNGWAFSLMYVAAFHAWGGPAWWKGALIGLVQSLFILGVILPVMPGMHPRMASEHGGPTIARQLEPPGFLALHYGVQTPVAVVIAHLAFGIILGIFYKPY